MSKVLSAQDGKINFNKGFLGIFKPKDFDKINTALQMYNIRVQAADGRSKSFAENLAKINPELSNYLVGLKGAEGTMKGYGVHLVGATIKTVALQAASMALNAALTWGVSLAIQGLISLGTYLWKLVPTTEHLKEQLEETAQALASIRSERESLNNELKTTEERIAELEAKGTLSFTEASELTSLKLENAELERKIALLDAEEEREVRKYNRTMNTTREKSENKSRKSLFLTGDYSDSSGNGGTTAVKITDKDYILELADAYNRVTKSANGFIGVRNGIMSAQDIDDEIDKMGTLVSEYEEYLKNMRLLGVNYQNADEDTKNNMDYAYEMIDAYTIAIGKTDILFSQVYNRDKFSEARKAIEDLGVVTAESLQELYNTNPQVKEFVDYLFSLGTTDAKNVTDFLSLLPGEFKKIEEAVENAKTSFKSIAQTLSDGLDKLSNKKDILSEVKEELDSFGAISADNISKILEQFSDNDDVQKAVAYYLSGIGTAQQLYDVMAKGYQNDLKLQAEKLATQMQNDENYYKSLAKLHGDFTNFQVGNYSIDLSNAKNLAEAKLKIENSLITTLKNNWKGYYSAQWTSLQKLVEESHAIYLNNIRSSRKDEYKQNYQNALAAYNQYKAAEEALNNLTLDGFKSSGFNASLSADFDKDSGKTEAEKYFDKQKYLLETNQITQEEYLKRINQKYKEFYKNQGNDLEDYAKYSQEVYDGFKDMYKEDLEAQKEAWEEKKDAVSEYYDNLREQIENAHDEEDYEKEQSEKRKEIFDLDMQIAELMRDGSEKAKARIAELEEERLKAEEELLDFETDKAREDELSRLEKEQKAEEDKIQAEIDKIDGDLKSIDENITKVRQDIINYARAKGVTLDFAHASGTRSSVGGFGRINEKGIEMISAPDGNGNYIPMLPNSYVFSAKATEFLWKLATEHSLPQAMYNSIAKSIKTQSNTPSVNIAQPINITMGDVIIKGNADKQTVADIKKQRESDMRWILQEIIRLQK